MEIVYNVIPQHWGHEVTQGQRTQPPTEDDLLPALDENGNPVFGSDGQQVFTPKPGWQPKAEAVNLDTVVLVEPQGSSVFKFLFDSDTFSAFLSFYVQHLDINGRQALREALNSSSAIPVAQLNTREALKDVSTGMNREQRRAAERAKR